MTNHANYWVEMGKGRGEWDKLQTIIIEAFKNDPWLISVCRKDGGVQSCLSQVLPRQYENYMRGGNGDFALIKTLNDGKEHIVGGVCVTYGENVKSIDTRHISWKEMTVPERHHDIAEKIIIEPMRTVADRHGREAWYGFKQAVSPELQGKGIGSRLLAKASSVIVQHGIKKRNLTKPPLLFGSCNSDITQRFVKKVGCIEVGVVKFFIGCQTMTHKISIYPIGGETSTSKVVADARNIFGYE